MRSATAIVLACLITGAIAGTCQADIAETTRELFVTVDKERAVRVVLTEVRDSARRRAPFALLLHGRPVSTATLPRLGRVRYPAAADLLARRGYAVLIPTRAGYGVSGGPDREYAGECDDKRTAPAVAFAAEEMRAVLRALPADAQVDPARGVVIGESFGGLVALALADGSATGVRAVVSFSAGDGGDWRRPGQPCQPERLAHLFGALGAAARRPALWLYSRNDLFWGSVLPAQWWNAWQDGGGGGSFAWLPASGVNGHFAFTRDALHWQAPVAAFLVKAGLP